MKKSTSKRVYIPRDFIECLREHVTGFADESEPVQWGLAFMLWDSGQKRRRHRLDPHAVSFSQQELDELFGRSKYQDIALRVALFRRSAGWSHEKKATRSYQLTGQARAALAAYRKTSTATPVELMHLKGKRMAVARTLPPAISSIGTSGKTVSTVQWDFAKETLNKVPVNTEMLEWLRQWFAEQDHNPSLDPGMKAYLQAHADTVVRLLRGAHTTLAGPGHIAQVYAIAPSGRLYARGLNLQNTLSYIKEAALHGKWEYDFANCHYTIISQMAAKFGVACPAIDHYMANKSAVRNEIAEGAGISIDHAKQCLLALLYGARTTTWRENAIPALIGVAAAKTLYALPRFKALSGDIDRARQAIVDGWPRTASGALTNASGRAIAGKESKAKILAHLVQGVEAEALRIIVQHNPEDIVLLQHDGFVSIKPLDCPALEQAIFDAVGYRFRLEETPIQLHADILALADRTKTEMDRETAPVLDFELIDVD